MNIGLSIFDFVLLGISFFIIVRASLRGFLAELFSTASLVVSFIISFMFYDEFQAFLSHYLESELFLPLISFLALFILSSLGIRILHSIISGILNNDTISSLDHALGFFLGLVKALALVILIIVLLLLQRFFSVENMFSESLIVKYLLPLISTFISIG